MMKNVVLSQEQLHAVALIKEALAEGVLPSIPSRFAWIKDLLELGQVYDYMLTGFNVYSTDPEEFYGTVFIGFLLGSGFHNPIASVIRHITAFNNGLRLAAYGMDMDIPDVDILQSWFCECGDEAEDPGMGCVACFTGVKDLIEEEGPFGGAFRDEMDYINWREGAGFLRDF